VDKHEGLYHALAAAWPGQHDIDIICKLPVGLSVHLHGSICASYSSSMDQDAPSPHEMLQLPPPGSHPVLVARKLLLLGTFLQGIVPSTLQDLPDLGASYHDIMAHVVDTATRLVTTNEELIGCVEGIECIMLESMYQNYAGNLHRAWMAVRRAAAVAEMLVLYRGLSSPSLKFLEPETRAAFDADQTCFRIVEMDCYLSLMLGFPRTSLQARFATPKALEGCSPLDRMQRIHCAVADRILQHNGNNASETHDTEALLQKAAAEMPPKWWLTPSLSVSNSGGIEVLHETNRLMIQFSHYHLLIRLHLPYMLRSSTDERSDHSIITAVNVGRESLARYIAFRTSNPAHFYCRGTDYLAFIATTVLCLAHIDARGRCQRSAQNTNSSIVSSHLSHSRPSDRGMMECTFDIIESMAHTGKDAIASKITRILRHLLTIEADAANDTIYSINICRDDNGVPESHSKSFTREKGLHVHIPCFGTINFEPRAPSKSVYIPLTDQPGQQNLTKPLEQDAQIGSQLFDPNTQTDQFQIDQQESPQQPHSFSNRGVYSSTSDNAQHAQLPVFAGIGLAENDWDLQGVDVALFDSLFGGTTIPNANEEESWMQWVSNG
jgi:hypothetical protein